MCNKVKNLNCSPCRLQQEILATRYMKMSGATVVQYVTYSETLKSAHPFPFVLALTKKGVEQFFMYPSFHVCN